MTRKAVAFICGFSVLAVVLFATPLATKGAPVVVAIVATVATVTTAVLVYDYNSCDLHIIWGCGGSGGGGGASGPVGGSGAGAGAGNGAGNGTGAGAGSGGGGGSLAGQACSSIPNSCGITSTGFTNAQGICGATPPPASSCPVPEFGEFSASPNLVRQGNSTTISWEVTSATACSINGGGLNLTDLSLTGSQESNSINNRTEFVLTCFNGDPSEGAPATSRTIVVNIVPAFEEI